MSKSQIGRSAPRKRRRRLLVALLAGLILLLSLAAVVAPTPLARFLLAQGAEAIGVEVDGLDTVKVDLFSSMIEAGPVQLTAPGAQPGELGRLGFRYDLKSLFQGRVLVETLVLDGINLKIERRPDGSFWVNGVDLETLLAGVTGDKVGREGGVDGGWQVGIDRFEVGASRVVLEDVNGGLLELDLRRLSLANFRSWEPESPGDFEFDGALNGIDVKWSGEARPFADRFEASTSGIIAGVTVDRIRRFTGPLGFSRREGKLGSRMEVRFSVDPTNSWQLGTKGVFSLDSVELATDDGLDAAVVSVGVDLDTVAAYSPEQGFTLSGSIGGDVKAFRLADGPHDAIAVEEASFALSDFAVTRFGSFTVARPTAGSAEDTRTPSLARQLMVWLAAIVLEFLNEDLDGKITGKIAANGIEVKAAGLVGSTEVDGKIGAWRTDFENVKARRTGDARTISGALSTMVEDLTAEIGLADGTASLSLDELTLTLPQLAGSREVGSAATTFVGSLNASGLSTGMKTKADGATREVNIGSLALEVPEFSGNATADGKTGSGKLHVTLSNFHGLSTARGAAGTIASRSMRLRLSSLAVEVGGERDVTRLTGDFDATEIQIVGPSSGDGVSLSAGGSRLVFDQMVVVRESDSVTLESHINGGLSNLRAEIATGSGAASAGAETLSVILSTLKARRGDAGVALTFTGSARGTKLTANLPELDPSPALQARVAELEVSLKDAGIEAREDAALWRLAADLEASGLALEMEPESRSAFRADKLKLNGVQSDQMLAVKIAEILVGDLDLDVSRRLIARLAVPKTEASTQEAPAAPSQGPTVSVAHLSLTPGSRIRFLDSVVEPPVEARALVTVLDLRNLDLADATQRIDIRLGLDFEGLGGLTLEGWAKPLKPDPDFDIKGEIQNLPLPVLSPYLSEAIGQHLNSGMLSATAQAAAQDGRLQGTIDLTIDKLVFEAFSDESKRQIADDLGVPVETVVSLLENSDRRITLSVPLSGTVAAPELDVSDAVGQAVGGAFAAIFPPAIIADLISKGFGGDVEFNPIVFQPGSTNLDQDGRDLADQIAVLLTERPKLGIVVCGRATAADLTVKDQAGNPKLSQSELIGLADRRTVAVRSYLSDQRSVALGRVGECRAKVVPDDQGPPRVDWFI